MKTASVLFLTAALGASASATGGVQRRATNWTIGQTVQTSSGPVTGHAAQNQSEISEYLGIPFAQPPVGNLRFAAPVKFTGTAPLNGTTYVGNLRLQKHND